MSTSTAAASQVAARRGLPVFCLEDRRAVGRVDGWVPGVEGGRDLLVRSGRWEPVLRRVPTVVVSEADERRVVLRLDHQRFERQPRYLPDPELVDALFHLLDRSDALRYVVTRFVGIGVRNSVVRVSGNLVSEAHRSNVLRVVARTPGVMRWRDDLATDERIMSAIALALLPHRSLQPSRVHVRSSFGFVTLVGELDSRDDVDLATDVAGAVRGVVGVRNELRVRPPRRPEPAPGAPRRPPLVRIELVSWPRWILLPDELLVARE